MNARFCLTNRCSRNTGPAKHVLECSRRIPSRRRFGGKLSHLTGNAADPGSNSAHLSRSRSRSSASSVSLLVCPDPAPTSKTNTAITKTPQNDTINRSETIRNIKPINYLPDYIVVMSQVKALPVIAYAVNNPDSGYKIDHLFGGGVAQIISALVTTIAVHPFQTKL